LRFRIPFSNKYIEIRSTLANPDKWLIEALGGGKAASGVTVNEKTALQSTAVFSCIRILSETIASLPLPVYRRLPGGGKERAADHYLYPLLHDQPNPEMTSFEFRETLMGHLALWGNAYAEIERDGAQQVRALWPLRPDRMTVNRDNQGLRYAYSLPDGTLAILRQRNIMHVRGLSNDGTVGYSPIRMAREAIGLALATEEYGARFFGSGSRPGGVLEHPGKLTSEAAERLRHDWEAMHSGLSGAHRVAILEEGLKWTQVGIPPEDAQYLDVRKFQIAEIARIFRVPLHLVNETDKAATYASVEQFALQFVVHTIRPWLVRWEQSFKRDLFLPAERDKYFAEFLVDGLLRGDIESRYRAYATARQWGWMSADDIRELENMNPLPDGQGKIYMVPLNMVPASAVIAPPAEEKSMRQSEKRDKPKLPVRAKRPEQYYAAFFSAADRLVRWEASEIEKLVNTHLWRSVRDIDAFGQAVERFYADERTGERIGSYVRAVVQSYAAIIADDVVQEVGGELADDWSEIQAVGYANIFVRDHIADSKGQLLALAREQEPETTITTRLDEWRERRPGKIAQWETVAAAGVFARYAMKALGITRLRWVAAGAKPCPYCLSLDGRVVGIDSAFAMGEITAEGEPPMRLYRNPRNPPAHNACSCVILPGI